ncbi:MAG: hypothetical protein Kow0088_15340 [Anaerolineales bacterium]
MATAGVGVSGVIVCVLFSLLSMVSTTVSVGESGALVVCIGGFADVVLVGFICGNVALDWQEIIMAVKREIIINVCVFADILGWLSY